MSMKDADNLFNNLFVLELANNHWGCVERGLKIIQDHARIVRYNNVKAAIKLQFRDVDQFIHPAYKGNQELRYVKKTEDTQMSRAGYGQLVKGIRDVACIPMATPFDEASVDLCVEFDLPIIKISSSDINDWPLIEKIAAAKRPVIVSTGGATEKDLDDIVIFFERRNVPLAINHCVSLYPSEHGDLELHQIDYLIKRYPGHVIGLSSHEYLDWQASMLISYAKGARTWERHIDIDYEGVPVSPYCSLPEQADVWYKAYKLALEMCGGSGDTRRICCRKEVEYLDALVRGVCARRDLEEGYVISHSTFSGDFYLAIPLRKGQLSCREVMNGEKLVKPIVADEQLTIDHIDGQAEKDSVLRRQIQNRGL